MGQCDNNSDIKLNCHQGIQLEKRPSGVHYMDSKSLIILNDMLENVLLPQRFVFQMCVLPPFCNRC